MSDEPIDERAADHTDDRYVMFAQRYADQQTPWDTGITPPEIVTVIAELPTGRALDLGCGTGTNVRFLAQHGWQADGVDFVPLAIERAQQKLADFPPGQAAAYCHDVTRLSELAALRPPYDLVVDIGCGHSLPLETQTGYAQAIHDLLRPGGVFMLFAHQPSEERPGWAPDDVRRLFGPHFNIIWQVINDDTTTGRPSGWYRLVRPAEITA